MEKPKIENFTRDLKGASQIVKVLDYTEYAFALEKYASFLEEKIKELEEVKENVV